ncbi:hypothetical protein BKA59DRAFT_508725 [Fusarium tricinctum]|uniref:Uncharacterized protein n=1 Tax=Fusarium tricinctum TaxID=61284 RepID=A0A8K0SAF5_9HYPO|nr:hypothetical protein BKA59DRAFT_508725 [Fusarium tricinctum]
MLNSNPKLAGEPGKDEETFSTSEFKALAVSCSNLFRYARLMYYLADNSTAFRLALERGDIDAIKRCAQFDAAPDTKWKLSQPCKCPADDKHKHHRPIDILLESVAIGCIPIDKCVEILRWLLENGYEANEQADQLWRRVTNHCDHMPELVVTLLNDSTGQASAKGIFDMIQLLRSHGHCLPFQLNELQYLPINPSRTEPQTLIRKPLDVALRSHCPTEFFEVVFQEYQNRQIDVKVWHSHPCPELKRWTGRCPGFLRSTRWGFQSTNVGDLIWGLFQDLADPMTPWKETFHGEAADIFERKIKPLVEHQFIESYEETLLQDVLQALREIAESAKIQGGIVRDRDGEVWSRLYDSIRPHATNEDIRAFHAKRDTLTGHENTEKTHRFIVEGKWDPYDLWFRYELQKPRVRDFYCHPWTSQPHFSLWRGPRNGIFVDTEWDAIVGVSWNRKCLPSWYDTTYSEFVAAVDRFWEKDKSDEKRAIQEASTDPFSIVDEYLDDICWTP